MVSKRIGLLTFLLWLVIPVAAFGQQPYSLDISPGQVYQPPGDPSCYTVTVGDGAYMTIDVLFTYEGGDPQEIPGWLTLDWNGQAMVCIDGSMAVGQWAIVGVRNTYEPYYYTSVYAPLEVLPAPPPHPWIDQLGSGCDNWDCIWITGTNFLPNSRVLIVDPNSISSQWIWGPGYGYEPHFDLAPDGQLITFQVTDPTLRYHFGYDGLWLYVWNGDENVSAWRYVQSPPPTVSAGDATCDDLRCLWMSGSFPLNAVIDLRPHGQPNVLPNSYTDLNVTEPQLSFRLNPSVYYAYDTAGLDAWVVNTLFPNWSGGTYFPPQPRWVHGYIDGISLSGYQYYLNGWACAITYPGSIDVHVYVGGPAGGGGTFAFSGTANIASEPNISTDCHSTSSHLRFSIPIPHSVTQQYGGQPIYVHGISPFGLANLTIDNSGVLTIPAVDRSITGWISGYVVENNQYVLKGWACAKTYPGSVDVHLYAGGPAGTGTMVTSTTANLTSTNDPQIAVFCNAGGTNYRFSIPLTMAMRQQYGGQPLYVHGISPFGLANSTIGNSGNINMPLPVATSSKEYIYIGDRLLAVDTTNLP